MKKTSATRFLLTVFFLAAAIWPIGYVCKAAGVQSLRFVASVMKSDARLVVYGNSVSRAYSTCDKERLSIPALVAKYTGLKTLDVSTGGLMLSEFEDINKFVLSRMRPEAIVIPVVPGAIDESAQRPREMAVRSAFFSVLSLKPPPLNEVFFGEYDPATDSKTKRLSFKGRYYGSYDEISVSFFSIEKKMRRCPENSGYDMAFVEFMNWRNYGNLPSEIEGERFKQMIDDIKVKGVKPVVYMPPVNVELIKEINDPAVYTALSLHLNKMRGFFRANSIEFIDLSEALSKSHFIDHWCACGHLGEEGRRFVSQRIAQAIKN